MNMKMKGDELMRKKVCVNRKRILMLDEKKMPKPECRRESCDEKETLPFLLATKYIKKSTYKKVRTRFLLLSPLVS